MSRINVVTDAQANVEQKAGVSGAIVDSLILEPNFVGIGVDLKKIFSMFKRKNNE